MMWVRREQMNSGWRVSEPSPASTGIRCASGSRRCQEACRGIGTTQPWKGSRRALRPREWALRQPAGVASENCRDGRSRRSLFRRVASSGGGVGETRKCPRPSDRSIPQFRSTYGSGGGTKMKASCFFCRRWLDFRDVRYLSLNETIQAACEACAEDFEAGFMDERAFKTTQ